MMQRRQFELIASLLRESYELGVYKSTKGYGQAVTFWADELQKTNPAFNRLTFLKATGVIK
jgi:hypothetical protein